MVDLVDALIARGEPEAKANGYVLLDTASRLQDHIRWTYLRLRGHSFSEIAATTIGSERGERMARGVAIAVRRMAVDIGLDLAEGNV